ncbi:MULTISPECIES: ABC transporter ATP-binding protein [unclassified Chelatococcus]|jgi:branched-chain amino acid transport system ATP-binding protein|uniref:ABC transporter ATP-binding protein n=1 Tax=unclassified Chelatococcus TaxID=2638111 RepID=UPI001BCD6784|nr:MULTISPECIES: ABC transporter ATP-binding protein [unclassified Chelatococcus]MBS7742677.1 ABC transporter ATP-binding protein [Chelatococcus sp. HY11]MBX3542205.1 ABC transporter ATP-binding protein [Chelatococcus sp.]MCO5075578.1 ABC transporter ATP-binding protein [Chelatococcus sp.]
MLEIRDLEAAYGPIVALHGINLAIAEGEAITVIGANGAGKSTLLKTICGMLRPRAGEIRFEGKPTLGLSSARMVQRGVALVPEGRHVFPQLTVRENLDLGAYYRRDNASVRTDLETVLDTFPILRERLSQPGGSLSGGQQQMLAIGRAMMSRPRLLMLDEPSLGLAPAIVQQLGRIIRDLNHNGTTILLVEQNARMALRLAHRAYVLATGRVTRTGTGQELLDDPAVKASYLGGHSGP